MRGRHARLPRKPTGPPRKPTGLGGTFFHLILTLRTCLRADPASIYSSRPVNLPVPVAILYDSRPETLSYTRDPALRQGLSSLPRWSGLLQFPGDRPDRPVNLPKIIMTGLEAVAVGLAGCRTEAIRHHPAPTRRQSAA